jgi:hypothetical protein
VMIHSSRVASAGGRSKRSALFSYCGALLIVLVASSLLLVGCEGSSHTATTFRTPTATPTPPAFPPFHEWRAAYINADKQLRAVTLDGTNNAAGPSLSPLPDGLAWESAGFSSDGHYFAFQGPTLRILDVTRPNARTPVDPPLVPYTMAWAPRGGTLAVDTGPGTPYVLIDAATGQRRQVPGTASNRSETPGSLLELIGWIDATHLAVTLMPGGPYYTVPGDPLAQKYPLTTTLASLDITTGGVRSIATITFSPQASNTRLLLSPDGTRALFYNWPANGIRNPLFTQLVDVIDIATGKVTPLPTIAAQLTKAYQWIASFAWRPGSDTIAASLPYPGVTQTVLLDIRGDSITHLNVLDGKEWVEAWTPDGKTLIVSTAWAGNVGAGPHDISALTLDSSGQTSLVLLTHDAYLASFAGFVRTA